VKKHYLFLLTGLILTAFSIPYRDLEIRLAQLRKQKKVVPMLLTKEKSSEPKVTAVEMGELLFNDVRLSRNNNVSCGTCHLKSKGFSNGQQFAVGTNGDTLTRHVPHLYNLKYNASFFWDGRVRTLEDQLTAVITSKKELDFNYKAIISRLANDTEINEGFLKAFPQEGLSKKTLIKSIVAYEESLLAGDSKYDLYLAGDSSALTKKELLGLELFVGKANCIACHFGPNLTDNIFHNVGVKTTDVGRQAVDKIGMNKEFESTPYPFFSTFKAFKTPSLRNVGLTAPYFHNGLKMTLGEVVAFYNSGGENSSSPGLAKEIVPLNLRDEEMEALVSFLEGLTSNSGN
jgi:cytochrome c peroxidase